MGNSILWYLRLLALFSYWWTTTTMNPIQSQKHHVSTVDCWRHVSSSKVGYVNRGKVCGKVCVFWIGCLYYRVMLILEGKKKCQTNSFGRQLSEGIWGDKESFKWDATNWNQGPFLALGFIDAGDAIVSAFIESRGSNRSLLYPALFCYRHHLELKIKYICNGVSEYSGRGGEFHLSGHECRNALVQDGVILG